MQIVVPSSAAKGKSKTGLIVGLAVGLPLGLLLLLLLLIAFVVYRVRSYVTSAS